MIEIDRIDFPLKFRVDKFVSLEEFIEDEILVSFDIEANEFDFNILRVGFFVDESWENGTILKDQAISKSFMYHLRKVLEGSDIYDLIEEKTNDYYAELANESRN